MKKILLLSIIFLASCSLNKVIQHQGIHNLEQKQSKLIINETNKNEIIEIIGPPSTTSFFNDEIYIYIEKKTTSTRLTKLGKKKLLKNDVLVLELNDRGVLLKKNFYNKDDMKNIKFSENITEIDYSKNSFVNDFLKSLRQKIDDPLNKKRIKN